MRFRKEPDSERKTKDQPLRPTFEFYLPEHPRYRCCCQYIHVRTGSIAISIICMMICAYFFVKGVVFLVRHPDEVLITSIVAVVAAVVCVFICILLLWGILKDKELFLIPYLVVQALVIFITFAMAILCILYLFTGESTLLGPTEYVDTEPKAMPSQEDRWWLKAFVVAAATVYSLAFGFGIWFFIVVVQCFRWMKERKTLSRDNEIQIPLTQN